MSRKKKAEVEDLETEFYTIQPILKNFCLEVKRQLDKILTEESISLGFPVQSRAKTLESILEKHNGGRFTIKRTINELQDLAGLRIILLFLRDVEKISKIIEQHFDIVKVYNTQDRLANDQFGYNSTHYIIKLKKEWLSVPTFASFNELKAEIQIRTLTQHLWAESSNLLHYKQEESVPKHLLRSIGRVSALLETVDLEYERLLNERANYKTALKEVKDINTDEDLDIESLQEIMKRSLPANNYINTNTNTNKISKLHNELINMSITKKSELLALIEKHLDSVSEFDSQIARNLLEQSKQNDGTKLRYERYGGSRNNIDRYKTGVFFHPVGLIRLIIERQNKTVH